MGCIHYAKLESTVKGVGTWAGAFGRWMDGEPGQRQDAADWWWGPVVLLARPSRKERGSGQTAIVVLRPYYGIYYIRCNLQLLTSAT